MRFPRYAWSVLGFNLFVILWGALVRASGSGAGCGRHWPLCNGEVIPPAPGTQTLIEFTHRATSGVAFLLVAALLWLARREFPEGHRVRRAAAWSLALIAVEALIGGGLVLLELVGKNDSALRAVYLAGHLLNTFLLLAALALTAHWGGGAPTPPANRAGIRGARWLAGAGLVSVLVVGMTGAIAALGDTLFPASSLAEGLRADADQDSHFLIQLRALHPVFALLAGTYLSVMVWGVQRLRPASLGQRWGRLVTGIVALQLMVGLSNLLLLAPIPLQLAHLLVADLLWITVVLFAESAR
jgi:cytochrome c oxidase assembly protein subunit 15/protoheme IX farnesyltransferase